MKKPSMLANTLPKALVAKLGPDLISKLCIKYGYRSRQGNRIRKCPKCGGHNLFWRKGEADGIRGVKCRDCKHVEPVQMKL